MAQTNILLESGTNELEIVEFYLAERLPSGEKEWEVMEITYPAD